MIFIYSKITLTEPFILNDTNPFQLSTIHNSYTFEINYKSQIMDNNNDFKTQYAQ